MKCPLCLLEDSHTSQCTLNKPFFKDRSSNPSLFVEKIRVKDPEWNKVITSEDSNLNLSGVQIPLKVTIGQNNRETFSFKINGSVVFHGVNVVIDDLSADYISYEECRSGAVGKILEIQTRMSKVK